MKKGSSKKGVKEVMGSMTEEMPKAGKMPMKAMKMMKGKKKVATPTD